MGVSLSLPLGASLMLVKLSSSPPQPRFLGLRLGHMEVLSLRAESELQLPAYTTAAATPDP